MSENDDSLGMMSERTEADSRYSNSGRTPSKCNSLLTELGQAASILSGVVVELNPARAVLGFFSALLPRHGRALMVTSTAILKLSFKL